MKNIFKKWWFYLIIIVLLIIMVITVIIINKHKEEIKQEAYNEVYGNKTISTDEWLEYFEKQEKESDSKNDFETQNDLISNYKAFCKGFSDDTVLRLKKTGFFEGIKYKETTNTEYFVTVTYELGNTKLDIVFDYDETLSQICLHNLSAFQLDKKQYTNQKLAISYLFDINEDDFNNEDESNSYNKYLNVISGIENRLCFYYRYKKVINI